MGGRNFGDLNEEVTRQRIIEKQNDVKYTRSGRRSTGLRLLAASNMRHYGAFAYASHFTYQQIYKEPQFVPKRIQKIGKWAMVGVSLRKVLKASSVLPRASRERPRL